MEIRVTGPGGPVQGPTVAVGPGQPVVLEASMAGSWKHNGTDVPVLNGTMYVTMDRDGSRAGDYVFVSNGVESTPITIQLRMSRLVGAVNFLRAWAGRLWRNWMPPISGIVVCVGFVWMLIAGAGVFGGESKEAVTARAYGVAGTALVLALWLLWLVGKAWPDSHGLLYLFKGDDLRASTSKVQYLIWTFGIAFVLAYIAARAGIAPDDKAPFSCGDIKANCIPNSVWDDYLILIGLPATTAAIAKGITIGKIADGALQKTQAGSTSPADIATDDRGQPDLVDVQYLLFNLIAFLYVAVHFAKQGILVEVPGVLLGLTSAAAGTYVLNKTLQNNKPVIVSISPTVITPDMDIRIRGRNLFPPGAGDTVSVDIGGIRTTGQRNGEDVTVVAPAEISDADAAVIVTTEANVATEKYPVTILDKLTIVGLDGDLEPRIGQSVKFFVEGLPGSAQRVKVRFGSVVVPGTVVSDGDVTAVVPPTLDSGEVDVKIGVVGRWSDSFPLTLVA